MMCVCVCVCCSRRNFVFKMIFCHGPRSNRINELFKCRFLSSLPFAGAHSTAHSTRWPDVAHSRRGDLIIIFFSWRARIFVFLRAHGRRRRRNFSAECINYIQCLWRKFVTFWAAVRVVIASGAHYMPCCTECEMAVEAIVAWLKRHISGGAAFAPLTFTHAGN